MSYSNRKRSPHRPPLFETLEERLLLTTLHAGEFFVYHNSFGEAVRITLTDNGPGDASVELFANEHGTITDLVGLPDGNAGDAVNWDPDLYGEYNGEIINVTDDGPEWLEIQGPQGEDDPDTLRDETAMLRGSRTELFAVYFSEASEDTVLTISTLTADQPRGDEWTMSLNPWSSGNTPVLARTIGGGTIQSPAGSGGVVVGTIGGWIVRDENYLVEYTADSTGAPVDHGIHGEFPGGPLYPGVSVSDSIVSRLPNNSDTLGENVHAVAVDGGMVIAADLDAFLTAVIAQPDDFTGIGADVDSLTDLAGTLYAIDNAGVEVGEVITDQSPNGFGADAIALAASNTGQLVGFDRDTNRLYTVNPVTGTPNFVGEVDDAAGNPWTYQDIVAMDFDPTTNTLYGIATVDGDGAPAGQHLITINAGAGTAEIVGAIPVADDDPAVPDSDLTAIAFSESGVLHGIARNAADTVDQIWQFDKTSAAVTGGPVNISLIGINSIDFIGEQMYGVSGSNLYRIDAGGTATPLFSPGLTGMTALAYYGGFFYTNTGITSGTGEDATTVYRLGRFGIASRLVEVDPDDGTGTVVGPLIDTVRNLAYRGVHAMGTDGAGTLYGTATVFDLDPTDANPAAGGLVIVTINETNASVTEVVEVVGTTNITTLAFDSADTVYAVDGATDELVTIDLGTGAMTVVGALPADVQGLSFAFVGGSEVLFGVTGSGIYAVDPATADTTLLGNTGADDLGSLAWDPAYGSVVWSTTQDGVADGPFRLARLSLTSTVLRYTGNDVNRVAGMFDDAIPQWGYVDVHALDYDSTGQLWGVGTPINLDPYGGVPDPADPVYLVQIDEVTGLVTRVGPLGAADLSTLAFDDADTCWGFDPSTDELVNVDTTDGSVAVVTALSITGVTGMDFHDGTLYAVAEDVGGNDLFYTIDTTTGIAIEIGSVDVVDFAFTGLADPDDAGADTLYATVEVDGEYYLMEILADPTTAGYEVGRIQIGGTVAGHLQNPMRGIDRVQVGFLWGQMSIGGNLNQLILRQGANGVPAGAGVLTPAEGAIEVGGTLGPIHSLGGTVYAGIGADNHPAIEHSEPVLDELEYKLEPLESGPYAWAYLGEMVHTFGWTNDDMTNAQMIGHPDEDFVVAGDGIDPTDWYSIAMLAGQTVTIEAGGWISAIYLYDAEGRWMDTWGFETIEDYGLGSGGFYLEPITFTAPAAGVYYLETYSPPLLIPMHIPYTMYVYDDVGAAMTGANLQGSLIPYFSTEAGRLDAAIATGHGGHIGGWRVQGDIDGASIATPPGGDIVAVDAGTIGLQFYGSIVAGRTLGSVRSWGDMWCNVQAGAFGGYDDSHIHNVDVVGTLLGTAFMPSIVGAPGNVGFVWVGGDVQVVQFFTEGGTFDLIVVEGAWGTLAGVPSLSHGVGGDFGYIQIGGTAYRNISGWIHTANPIQVTDGSTSVVADDGGGQIEIQPRAVPVLDDDGNPVEDENGDPVFTQSTYSYLVLPVDGSTGGVLSYLDVAGEVRIDTIGSAHISEISLTPAAGEDGESASEIRISGDGETSVYYVHSTGPVTKFINDTTGGIVSGLLGGDVEKIEVGGTLGARSGSTPAWLPGRLDPTDGELAGAPSVPLYGWFRNRINGLAINGSVDDVEIGGALGDLRISGQIGTVEVNADNLTPSGEWHGVMGVVWAAGEGAEAFDWDPELEQFVGQPTTLDEIYVGDGLADDGAVELPRAGILVDGNIGGVYIEGPRFEVEGLVYGEINGAIIGTDELSVEIEITEEEEVVFEYSNVFPAVGEVIGTDGASLTAVVLGGTSLAMWQSFVTAGGWGTPGIGTVEFSGSGAQIHGAAVGAGYVNEVITSHDSNGIWYTTIEAHEQRAFDLNPISIGEVVGGGPGFYEVTVTAFNASIGEVRGDSDVADIYSSSITSAADVELISSRDFDGSYVNAPGTVDEIDTWRDFFSSTASIGAVEKFDVGRNVENSSIIVAAEVGSMQVDGDFIDTVLYTQGPTTGYLRELIVEGDISGRITSGGHIGTIESKTGAISANVMTLNNNSNNDIEEIKTFGGFTGTLDVGDTLHRFESMSDLGSNPELTGGETQVFNIYGELGELVVDGPGRPNLYADFTVGGNVGDVEIAGTFYSNMFTNADMESFTVGGQFGGMLDLLGNDGIPDTARGSLTIFGDLHDMSFPTTMDMFADLTVGGSLEGLQMNGGSINGDVTSRYGRIGDIKLKGGAINGNLTAKAFDKIDVKGGGPINGDITATDGNVDQIKTDGPINGTITVAGRVDKVQMDGDLNGVVNANAGIDKFQIKGGDLDGQLISAAHIGKLQIKGSDVNGLISAAASIEKAKIDGDFNAATLRSGQSIVKVSIGGGLAAGSIVSAAWNIDGLDIGGNMAADSMILAGYDVGPDGLLGTADDEAASGSIMDLSIGGSATDAVLAAGIGPGADNDFRTTLDNDPGDVINAGAAGDGISRILDVEADGGWFGDTWALAETDVVDDVEATILAAGGTVWEDSPNLVPGGGPLPVGPLTVTLDGPGAATWQPGWAPGVDRIILNGTTGDDSELTVSWTGGGVYGNTINVVSADDSGLSDLAVEGMVNLGDVEIDGRVGDVEAWDVADGSDWALPGGVESAEFARPLQDVSVAAGPVGDWEVNGGYTDTGGTTFTCYVLDSLSVDGSMGVDLVVLMSGVGKLDIAANQNGDMTLNGESKKLSFGGDVNGVIAVHYGDVSKFDVGRDFTGRLNVERGEAGKVSIGRDFTGADSSIRAFTGVGKFDVGRDFAGLLATHGDIGKLQAKDGVTSGRVWAAQNIDKADFGSLVDALVAASANVGKVKVDNDMVDSYLFSGFNPGDAGYDPAAGGEAANVRIDAWTDPAWNNAANADTPQGGDIDSVDIGGDMVRSTISAGVAPGEDGYVGTTDDVIGGTGYIHKGVQVDGLILGDDNTAAAYGVYAANAMPEVTFRGKMPFSSHKNARVNSYRTAAGTLQVMDVYFSYNFVRVTFNHAVNSAPVDTSTFLLEASLDNDFATLADNTDISTIAATTITFDPVDYTVTYQTPLESWEDIADTYGDFWRLTIDDSVYDLRGNLLDGEFDGSFPSGDRSPGGDFVWQGFVSDPPDEFDTPDGLDDYVVPLDLDGGTQVFSNWFSSTIDTDIYGFSGTADQFLSVEFNSDSLGQMGVFFHDDQGTPDPIDDTYEILARYEYMETSIDRLFQAFELPETGDYFLAVTPSEFAWSPLVGSRMYGLSVTLSSSDTQLVNDIGAIPPGEEIAYYSNTVGEHNNHLGANTPKQLVYLDFDGGTATQYTDYASVVNVDAFDAESLDASLLGMENTLIEGGAGVTGVVDNVMAIFQDTPGTHPWGALNVQRIDVSDPADWAAYQAAAEGLFFTTVDPAVAQGLDPDADFTTVFIGEADTGIFGGNLLGLASGIDVANQDKGDEAIVFSQVMSGFEPYTSDDLTTKANQYSQALANIAAHELGHVLGLNHQPTYFGSGYLLADDPNNDGDASDANTGLALMGYPHILEGSSVAVNESWQLGTAELSSREFPTGHIDTADLLLKWLS